MVKRFEEGPTLVDELNRALKGSQAESIQMELQVGLDHLTGLFNRRAWDKKMETLIGELNRISYDSQSGLRPTLHKVLVFALDLNKFKFLNDTYGHPAGDQALRDFANHLRTATTRKSDMLFRTGGDEFMIVCPMESAEDVSNDSVQKLLERIKNALGQKLSIKVKNKNGETVKFPITTSMGHIVLERGKSPDFETVYKQVDQKLYENKHLNNGATEN